MLPFHIEFLTVMAGDIFKILRTFRIHLRRIPSEAFCSQSNPCLDFLFRSIILHDYLVYEELIFEAI